MKDRCLLIGDIGGTNARFALATPDRPGFHDVLELQCADFASADDAISHYLVATKAGLPDAVCLAAAGPIVNDTVKITNNHWDISAEETRTKFGIDAVRLLNDFTAIAHSIPLLTEREVRNIGPHKGWSLPAERFDVAILGPGTGLGVAGLCRRGDALVAITGEGGHVGFAPENRLQTEILDVLREKYERVSAERLIAGSGLGNIYEALVTLRGEAGPRLSAKDIFEARGSNQLAAEAIELFFELLGQVAGDLALTLGAVNGVYIAGGIAKRYPEILENSRFRSGFESKGRHRTFMERIPTRLITYDQPGLLGAAYCVLELSS
ncbi:MAG: glucokinase [Gammaproteobacteria bacterium]|nr:glucokinase [Gammaproteobacteria bacterium]MDH3363664.1 glucokinase [Gammaproteobacteria bacterium]MDH3481701.1 glucokinase [Gammaproteobacteria bacterium]